MKKILLTAVFAMVAFTGFGQGYLSFYQLRDIVPQTQGLNPAYTPEAGFIFSIPALNSSFQAQAGFASGDLLVQQDNGDLEIDFDNLLSVTDEENELGVDFTSNLFHIQFNALRGSISLFSNLRGSLNLQYDDDLINLLANGNGGSIGETISLNENIDLTTYNEVGIGYATTLLDNRLKIGARFKYLNGQFYAGTTEDGQLDIYTDPENYNITISAENIRLQTAGVDLLLNEDEYQDDVFGYATWTDNTGFAMDFGATFDLTDKLSFDFALTDIGSITWKDMVVNYTISDDSMTLDGVDLNDDSEEGGFEQIEQDLETFFEANETYDSFTTSLNMKTYLGATYLLAPAHRFGFTAYNNAIYNTFNPSYAVSYNWLPGNRTTIGTLMSFGGLIPEPQLGFNLATSLGPIQFYAATNDLLAFTKSDEITGANIRFGLNIMLGRNRYKTTISSSSQDWD